MHSLVFRDENKKAKRLKTMQLSDINLSFIGYVHPAPHSQNKKDNPITNAETKGATNSSTVCARHTPGQKRLINYDIILFSFCNSPLPRPEPVPVAELVTVGVAKMPDEVPPAEVPVPEEELGVTPPRLADS